MQKTLLAFLLIGAITVAQESLKEDKEPLEGVLETTVSKDFNYGLFFLPIKKGLALDVQYYWTSENGSQSLIGGAYIVDIKGFKLIPGVYYVAESCNRQAKPYGCHDVAAGIGWEWKNENWTTRGFIAQTLRKSELKFGLLDPAQFGKRMDNGQFEFGFAFIGEESKEEEKTQVFGKGGMYARRYMGKAYLEGIFLTGHHGPEMRFTIGRVFKGFGQQ